MKRYLSFGAGVNSTALMLLLLDEGIEFETVFVDTGAERPETYEYVDYLIKNGFDITIIKPNVEGCNSLYEYCLKYKMTPSKRVRWCTQKFKTKPFYDYIKKPCVVYIGIDYSEIRRLKNQKNKKDIEIKYPLVERKIDRNGCIKIIKEHGLKIPERSGCWLCPFQTKTELINLRINHPDLFKKFVELEKLSFKRREENGKPKIFVFRNKPIEEHVPKLFLTRWFK